MRLFTSLKLGSYKPLALAIMMLVSSVFAAVAWPAAPEANAITAEICYGINNKPYFASNKDQNDCIQQGYCEVYQFRTTNYTTEDRLRCNEELYQSRVVDPANNDTILNAQISPVVIVICGQPSTNTQADAAYADCYAKTKAQYVVCVGKTENGGNPSDDEILSSIASCVRDWAKTTYPSKKIDLNVLTAAVAKGRDDGQTKAEDIGAVKNQKDCEKRLGVWADGKCAEKQAVLCSGGALGWIMCPLAELATSVTEFFALQISSFLTFSPLLNSAQGKAIQGVWQLIVNIANILLVIAFLMVVFSQATSVGLSNYGIKKMLPKIIAAAILMNLSFFICAVAIDISNVLGQSVAGIIQVGIDQVDKSVPIAAGNPLSDIKSGSDGGDMAFVSLLGALGIGGLIIAPGLLYFILPILVSAAAAMFTALGVIIFRQVALVIMIILSPLAFVAWILPNTESWFEKWRKFFIALLVMFPLIMGIFYGATFLSHIMLLTLDPSKPTEMNIVKIMALAVLVLPLFALPFIMKMAGGILERFGALVNDRQKGLIDRSRNWAKDNSKRTNDSQRARMASARWGVEKDAEGNVLKNPDGTVKKKGGFKGRAARGFSSSANFVGGNADNRERKHAEQERNAKRIQEDQWAEILSEVDPTTGKPTARAQRYATAAAGAGGAEGAERIRQLATEQRLKEYSDEVGRRNKTLGLNDLWSHDAQNVTAYDKDGNVVVNKNGKKMDNLAMHERIAAGSSGHLLRWTDTKGKQHEVDFSDEYWKEAAMEQINITGDNKAVSATITGEDETFKVKDSKDLATLKKYIIPNSAFRGTFPQIAKTDGGAWTAPSADQISGYFVDTARLSVDYAEAQYAKQKSDYDSGRTTLKPTIEIMREEFKNAVLNDNNYNRMDVRAREEFERRLGLNAKDIRAQAGKSPTGSSVSSPQPQKINITVNPAAGNIPVPSANEGRWTVGFGANDMAGLDPQSFNSLWQNAQRSGVVEQNDLIKFQAVIDQSGKDYGDTAQQIQQAFDDAGLRK